MKLTLKEAHLLIFPPTQTTWLCGHKVVLDSETKKLGACRMINPGTRSSCWHCGTPKSSKPNLLWPLYVKTCEKAGIEPGTKYNKNTIPNLPVKRRQTRRKTA